MELVELVKRAQTGDAEAQGELYEKTYKRVYYLALRLTKNPEDAQDAAQDAFMAAFQALSNLREPNAFEGWLFQITANKCRNRVARAHIDEELPEGFEEHEPDPQEDLIPEDALQSAEKRRLILEIIDELPETQRECVMLFYYSEMSVKQIAETLECSEGTVKSRLNYARQKIKDGILSTEERDNIRLHTFVPFGLFLLKDSMFSMAEITATAAGGAAAVAAGASAGTSSAGTAAGTVKAGLLATAKAKVIAGVTAAAIVVGGGAAVVSQMPKAIAFSDPAMEQNIRVLVDKPEGKLYADDLQELYGLYLFDDGMALSSVDGMPERPQSGTTAVESLEDLSKLPNLMSLYYTGHDQALLDTFAPDTGITDLFLSAGWESPFLLSDVSFLDRLPQLQHFLASVAPGTDLSPIERRSSLQMLELSCSGSVRLNVDELQGLLALDLAFQGDPMAESPVIELVLTRELPDLRNLMLFGGTVPKLDFLTHMPALQMLDLSSDNLSRLDLSPVGGLQSLRAMSLTGSSYDESLDLAPLASCPALEVYSAPNGQCFNLPPQAVTDTESSMPNYNRVSQEVQMGVYSIMYEDMHH